MANTYNTVNLPEVSNDTQAHFGNQRFPDYDCIGISADFKTAFGSNIPLSGSYGLKFYLTIAIPTEQVKVDETQPQEYTFASVPLTLDSSQMWGNPFHYGDYSTQTARYNLPKDADGNLIGIPVGIEGYFYQNFDFVDEKKETYPYYLPVEFNNGIPVYTRSNMPTVVEPNLFVKNIQVSFGYMVESVEDDTIFLFTTSNTSFAVDDFDYKKNLQARFIYVADDNITRIAINGQDEFETEIKAIPSLKDAGPMIRWYRYNLKEGVQDLRAGDL